VVPFGIALRSFERAAEALWLAAELRSVGPPQEREQMRAAEESGRREDIVVFSILRTSECSECGEELGKGRLLRIERDRPLCLQCADLDRLVFLPSGEAALTRRATKYSKLRAVVVRFSRARKRYERQGVLVQEPALDRAERECLADADARERARVRAAERREEQNAQYVASFAKRLGELFPGCSPPERHSIAQHACSVRSGRVGRSASAKRLDASAIEVAVRAHVRHGYTEYDELLAQGWTRQQARAEVAPYVDEVLEGWRTEGVANARGGPTSRCS